MTKLMILFSLFIAPSVIFGCKTFLKPYGRAEQNVDSEEICSTASCIEAASVISEKMDETVDPCDDFYTFSCGNFIKNTIIPDDKFNFDEIRIITDKVQEQLKNVLSKPIEENEIEPFKLAKKFYRGCMNETKIEKRVLQSMLDIHDKMGGWPVIKGDEWDDSRWTWQNATKDCRKYGLPIDLIVNIDIVRHSYDSSKQVIAISKAHVGLNYEYLIKGFENEIVQAYYSYQVDMAVLFGADRNRAEQEMKEVLNFEIALANILISGIYYNTIKNLQTKYSYINWLDYLNSLLPNEVQITEDEEIANYASNFFDELGPLLERTPKRTIANYIMWRTTKHSASFLSKAIRKRNDEFEAVKTGIKASQQLWYECVSETTKKLPIATGALYVRNYFDKSLKDAASQMVQSIKEEFRKILGKVEWLDFITRRLALTKLINMGAFVGYPDELLDDQKLIDFYSLYQVDEDKYLESTLSVNIINMDKLFKSLRKPNVRNDWTKLLNSATVNAFYTPNQNSIQIPAAVLQGHLFSADRPKYLNYGAIGYFIGHEITHGFDHMGRNYNKDGNLINLWMDEAKNAFIERARCFVEQYGNYTDPDVGLKLNAIKTENENIADNGGVKVAYNAYQSFVTENGVEPRLPNLNYTTNQMFWISAAQTWCSVNRPEFLKDFITTNEHVSNRFRVLGPFKNSKEFSKDFNCPAGSPMNPVEKCEVW